MFKTIVFSGDGIKRRKPHILLQTARALLVVAAFALSATFFVARVFESERLRHDTELAQSLLEFAASSQLEPRLQAEALGRFSARLRFFAVRKGKDAEEVFRVDSRSGPVISDSSLLGQVDRAAFEEGRVVCFQPAKISGRVFALRRGEKTVAVCFSETSDLMAFVLLVLLLYFAGALVVFFYYKKELALERERELGQRLWESQQELVDASCRAEQIAAEKFHERTRDYLTALWNDRFFEEELEREVIRAEKSKHPFAVVIIRVSDIRAEFYGRRPEVGYGAFDRMIWLVAKKLREWVPRECFLARIGRREFGVIIPGSNEEEAQDYARKLCQLVESCKGDQVGLPADIGFKATAGISLLDPFRFPEVFSSEYSPRREAEYQVEAVRKLVSEAKARIREQTGEEGGCEFVDLFLKKSSMLKED